MPDILHRFFVKTSVDKVFNIFTTPAGLNAWWPLKSEGKPALNEIYRFYFGAEYDWRAKVIHIEPNKECTWQMTEAIHDWMPTKIGFVLTPERDGTAVYFFHNNWQQANEHFAISNFCWGNFYKD